MPLDSTGPESLSAQASNRSRLSLILRISSAERVAGEGERWGGSSAVSWQLRPGLQPRESRLTEGLSLSVVRLGGH